MIIFCSITAKRLCISLRQHESILNWDVYKDSPMNGLKKGKKDISNEFELIVDGQTNRIHS